MKPAMRKNDGKKRRSTEMAPPDAPIALGSPKRNKVHAQRKFAAQGAGASPTSSPSKERERSSPARPESPTVAPSPSMRLPRTVDFLDYVCFKQSPVLGPTVKSFFEGITSSTIIKNSAQPSTSTMKPSTKGSEKNLSVAKKKQQSAGVRALCQKYQEQRIAKQKPSSVTTLAKKVKGKNMVRTRAAAEVREKTVKTIKKKVATATKGVKSLKGRLGLRSGLKRAGKISAAAKRKLLKKKLQRSGLRSGGSVDELQVPAKVLVTPKVKKPSVQEIIKKPKPVAVPVKLVKPKVTAVEREIGSDFSSDDNEPLLTTSKPVRVMNRHIRTRPKLVQSPGGIVRPSRRTKATAALHMKIMSRRLTSPSADDELSPDTTPDRSPAKRHVSDKNETAVKVAASGVKSVAVRKVLPKSVAAKKMMSKTLDVKKVDKPSEDKKRETGDRPTTRSRPFKEKFLLNKELPVFKKPAVTSLIQKKKLNSLRTLTRLGLSKKLAQQKETEKKVKPPQEKKRDDFETGAKDTKKDVKKDLTKKGKDPPVSEKKLLDAVKTRGKLAENPAVKDDFKSKLALKMKVDKNQNKAGKKPKQMIEVEVGGLSKRPSRRCSKVDKIWIDIDGFTSDEDDFIDLDSISVPAKAPKSLEPKSEKGKVTGAKSSAVKKATTPSSKAKASDGDDSKSKTSECADKQLNSKMKASGDDENAFTLKSKPSVGDDRKPGSGGDDKASSSKSKAASEGADKHPIPKSKASEGDKSKSLATGGKALCSEARASECDGKTPTSKSKAFVNDDKATVTKCKPSELDNKASGFKSKALEEPPLVPFKPETKEEPVVKPIAAPPKPAAITRSSSSACKTDVSEEKSCEKAEAKATVQKFTSVRPSPFPKSPLVPLSPPKTATKAEMEDYSHALIARLAANVSLNPFSQAKALTKEVKSETESSPTSLFRLDNKRNLTNMAQEVKSRKPDKSEKNHKLREEPSKLSHVKSSINESKATTTEIKSQILKKNVTSSSNEEKKFWGETKSLPSEKKPKVSPPRRKRVSSSDSDDEIPIKVAKKLGKNQSTKDESDVSSRRSEKETSSRRASRPIRPRSTAEAITRKERPKRQCSSFGKVWIERDSDSSFYDDDGDDVFELIRQSELAEKKKELARVAEEARSLSSASKEGNNENFSDSDDEPLKKKPMTGASNSVTSHDSESTNTKFEVLPCDTAVIAPTIPEVRFVPPSREPINTHGLDLLSQVVTIRDAASDKSTERIEQWLKDSIRSDSGKGFIEFGESEIRAPPTTMPVQDTTNSYSIPNPRVQFVRSSSEANKSKLSDDTQAKVIKKPLQPFLKRPPVSSVNDLLKLQRERKESQKPVQEQHPKNCQCNSCVVKKAWFKNKPMPGDGKAFVVAESMPAKPFQSLTKAFAEAGTGTTAGKASASVAPFVASPEKGPQRKMSFLERMRERERKEAMVRPHPNAFSPSNESSVYAFEPETAAPLRKQQTIQATCNDELVEENKHQSTSIAVQVNLDSASSPTPEPPATPLPVDVDGKSNEISTQTDGAEDDPDSPMFYIPLQQSLNSRPLIQGVALKLGTEGPPTNQRVVMKAKLVTQTQSVPSVKAVVMPQQQKPPPVGTVQPTTRRPPSPAPPRTRKSARGDPPSSETKVQSSVQVDATSPPPLASRGTRQRTRSVSVGRDSPKAASSNSASSTSLMEAPTFHLTEKEFQDPLEFFERIRPMAERFGLCRIVPPSSFKPDCKVVDEMRFTAYNQYVHRMFHRWGPSVRETMAIKKYLKKTNVSLSPPPCVGGMEVDLPRLHKAVETCGGPAKVVEKQKWPHIADILRIPKSANERISKLESIYYSHLVPYAALSQEERKNLLAEVEMDWKAHEQKIADSPDTDADGESDSEDYIDECDECIVKGKSMALNQFYRIARNTMSMWFKSAEPNPFDVETEFWKHVKDRSEHICVHSGSIDSSRWGYGFPIGKNNFAKHAWNLKVLTNNSGSVLRSLGPVMGLTVPTLHVGMVFAAFCWYRDPHGLPWVEYLHTGAPKIWYGISDDNSSLFRDALTKLLPRHIKDKRIWLPSDTAMPPPESLAQLGVPLCRTMQEPGQFVLVFPRAFTSSLCTGYLVSESVYFARPSWLQTAEQVFSDMHESAEPSEFSIENLLFSIAADSRANLDLLNQVLPMLGRLRERELEGRRALIELGMTAERLPKEERRSKKKVEESGYVCDQCRASLFLSHVSNAVEKTEYCLKHGLQQIAANPHHVSSSKLLFGYDEEEINEVLDKLTERIENKMQKAKK